MRRILFAIAFALVIGAGSIGLMILRAQQDRSPSQDRQAPQDRVIPLPRYEVKSVMPREISPGQFEQVSERDLQSLAEQGWELVSVMPYVYRNEERGPSSPTPRPIVTQTYPAYFFKRVKVLR